jgi:preprotein translocase SecE subunit
MERLRQWMRGVAVFWDEVVAETRKTDWPPRQELVESTVVVLVAVVLLSVFVGVGDKLLVTLISLK